MDNFEHFKELYNFIKDFELNYNSDSETITIISDSIINPDAILSVYTKINGGLEFSVNIFDYVLFFDEKDFKQKWKKAIDSNKDIAILNIGDRQKYFLHTEQKSYNNFTVDSNFYFQNVFIYNNFINLFVSKSNSDYREFQFVDSFDTNSRKLFFTSSKEPGKLVLSYPSELPDFNETTNYSIILKRLVNSFEPVNKYLPLFIKNEIFRYFNDKNENNGFVILFQDLENILDLADKNYQIYLHDLSLDKIKSDYKEYKQKYFSSQNDILSKLTTQVVALPVSIAASAFSIYNLKGDIFPTMIIVFGLICYVIYVTFTLSIFYNDIYSLNKLAQRDYTTLKTHPFFVDNPNELSFFNEIKDNIFNRLKSLKIGLNIFVFMVWGSFTMLAFYSLKTLSIELKNPIILFVLIASIFTLTYVNLLNKEELENN